MMTKENLLSLSHIHTHRTHNIIVSHHICHSFVSSFENRFGFSVQQQQPRTTEHTLN